MTRVHTVLRCLSFEQGEKVSIDTTTTKLKVIAYNDLSRNALTSTNATTADLLACFYPSSPRVLPLVLHMRQIMRLTGALDLVYVIRGGASKFRETGSCTFRNRVRRCTPLWLTLAQQVNAGLVNFGRAYGSSGGASEQTKTHAARSYLERWAGIRDGIAHRSEAATSGKSYSVPKFPRRITTCSDIQ